MTTLIKHYQAWAETGKMTASLIFGHPKKWVLPKENLANEKYSMMDLLLEDGKSIF